MTINPTPALLETLYWISLIAVATGLGGGPLLFIGLLYMNLDTTFAAAIAGLCIFTTRLLALYYNISLPKFRFKAG